MASDQHPLDSFLAAARGALAHLHLPGSDSKQQQQQQEQRQPDCLLHLHVVLANFLHKPLRSFSRCFGNDHGKPRRGRSKPATPPLLHAGKRQPQPQQQLELLLCIAFDALAHNLQVLEGACKQKGEEFGSAACKSTSFRSSGSSSLNCLLLLLLCCCCFNSCRTAAASNQQRRR